MTEYEVQAPKALVVDDDAAVARAIGKLLEKRGYTVATLGDSGLAARRLRNEVFDLVVSDMYMPGMDGMTLLKQVVQKYPVTATVLLTGAPTRDLENGARALSVDAFLDKGAAPAEIEEALNAAMVNKTIRLAIA